MPVCSALRDHVLCLPLQAFYEIFTTENSYGYSLDVLISEFVEDPHINPHSGGDCIISKRDFQVSWVH